MQTRPLPILSTSLNHPTLSLTSGFQRAIQGNNIRELKAFDKLYTHLLKTNVEFGLNDCSDLKATYQTTMNILNTHIFTSTPLPNYL